MIYDGYIITIFGCGTAILALSLYLMWYAFCKRFAAGKMPEICASLKSYRNKAFDPIQNGLFHSVSKGDSAIYKTTNSGNDYVSSVECEVLDGVLVGYSAWVQSETNGLLRWTMNWRTDKSNILNEMNQFGRPD